MSLTFDDSLANQRPAADTLRTQGLAGSFYAVDQWVGRPGYFSRADLMHLNATGHEIGGHTVSHADLATVSTDEARRQVCNNRATLESWGLRPTTFAYPYASSTSAVEDAVRDCGYVAARGLGDVRSPAGCYGCPRAESLAPEDPYYLQAPDQVDSTWTLSTLQWSVRQAARSGGWLLLTFHGICAPLGIPSCPAETSTTPATFTAFARWLARYRSTPTNRTAVRTVDEQLRAQRGADYPVYRPATRVAAPPAADPGVNAIRNADLETANSATGYPDCFQAGGYGTNQPSFATSSPGRSGSVAQSVAVTGYVDGDAKLLPRLDLGECAPTVVAGRQYQLGVWFQSTAITQLALYYRDADGVWRYWTSGPWIGAASAWTHADMLSPPVPAGATALSFGLALIANGTLRTDDYSLIFPG